MASTYSTSLKLELIGTGEQSGTWGETTNTNLGTTLEQAIVGKADIDMSSTTITLTLTSTNALQDARAIYLNLSGTPGGPAVLEVPAVEKPYIVKNGADDEVTIKVSGQTGVAVPVGKTTLVYNNGTDVVTSLDYIPSLTLGTALSVASGGTGITSFGSGVATWLGTPSSANLASAVTDDTGSGSLVFGTNPTLTGFTLAGNADAADYLVGKATLRDYAIEGSIVGNTDSAQTIDMEDANFFAMTANTDCTFTFTNPPASGNFGAFVLELTNGGSHTITWPASVDWPLGVSPTLSEANGVDQLVFTTRDGGTTWFGFLAGRNIQTPS